MDFVGFIVAVSLAIGGWIVSGVLARRAKRRELRVEYLLKAYRALDEASNRQTMTVDHARATERAIADVQLLGTNSQVALADAFALGFAESGSADSTPLLESLRGDLRKELLLGEVAPRSAWLRIDEPGGHWAAERARIVAALEHGSTGIPASGADSDARTRQLAVPVQAIESAYESLRSAVDEHGQDRGALSPANAQAVEGLQVLHDLALRSPGQVSSAEAEDFIVLARAAEYAVRTAIDPE